MSYAIRVENLGKQYRLGATHDRSVRDAVNRVWTGLFGRRTDRLPHEQPSRAVEPGSEFWALRDVSFEVQPGEVVGIIGRNGSGKSTLLKILSQITAPTTGRVELHGRIASLLEVGTGFHPELSGRENVFLNGAILGMTRPEIRRKFDEIVAFAEIEKFIDTPVKRYSSGMYVRLAFAVAAHLEPEILVVDEVLAVGDADFQKKCIGKMGDVARGGRTVLFVSHNMAVVSSLCDRCVLLDSGRVEKDGPATATAEYYQTAALRNAPSGYRDLKSIHHRGGDQKVRFTKVTTYDKEGKPNSRFGINEPIRFSMELTSDIQSANAEIGLTIKTLADLALFTTSSTDEKEPFVIRRGDLRVDALIDPNHLRPGTYIVQLGMTCGILRDLISDAIQITIDDSKHYSKNFLYTLPGHLYFPYSWSDLDFAPATANHPSAGALI